MKNCSTDVLIVGAGPTGLFLSNLLASHHIKNILIEKNSSTVKEPRAVSIDAPPVTADCARDEQRARGP